MEKRYVADCRKFKGSTCSLTIAGTKKEVLPVAIKHAIDKHGHKDSSELKAEIEATLVEES